MTTLKVDGLLQRRISVKRDAIDVEARTVELSVSSEASVERWFGNEILDHGAGSIRLERLRNAAPVLVDHYSDQIGVVEEVRLDGTQRRLRVRLRFGSGQRASEVFQDIVDGIRQNVSIGYRVHKMNLESAGDGGDTYRATDWEPYEVSIVSTPADISVGVGRATQYAHDITIERGNNTMTTPDTQEQAPDTLTPGQATTPAPETTVNRSAVENDVRTAELKRIRDLEALGDKFKHYGGAELARQMIRDGKSVEAFRNAILEKLPTREKAGSGGMPASALGMSEREAGRYSLMRAINAAATGDWSKAGFEQECSVAVGDQLGREARGFYVPYDVLGKRTMSTAAATGGRLVNDEYMPGEFIDRLRDQTLVSRLGARYLTGLVGNPDIPGGATGATFYWLAEDEAVTNSDITFRSVNLSPKTVAGAVAMTRRLMLQSSPDIEALVQDELLYGMALAIDTAVINGTGLNNQPKGILNQAGLLTVALAAEGEPTRQEMRKFKTTMKKANSYLGNPIYLTTPDIEAHLEDVPVDSGSGRFLLENGRVLGHAVESSNLMPENSLILGNFADVIIGMWGVLDLMPDKAAKAASGGLVVRVFQDVDIAIRHPQSFVKAVV